jgi:hypothetical protein
MASRTIEYYEGKIETENAKEFPNERNVAFWVGRIGALQEALQEEQQRQALQEEQQRQEKKLKYYERLIETENAKEFPNERNVALWVDQIRALRNASLVKQDKQDILNEASKFSFFDTVPFSFISNKFQIMYFSQHLILDICICLQIFLGLLSTFSTEERVAWYCGIIQTFLGLIINFLYAAVHLHVNFYEWLLSFCSKIRSNFTSSFVYVASLCLSLYRKCADLVRGRSQVAPLPHIPRN